MKVLFVGYSKTGTTTCDAASSILGYKVCDYEKWLADLTGDWENFLAGNGSPDDLRRMYKGYDATSDMPAFTHWREFYKAFPDIKIILSERDEASWLKSWNLHTKMSDRCFSVPYHFSKTAYLSIHFWTKCMKAMISHPPPTSSFFKKSPHYEDEAMLKSFRDHNWDVIQNAPKMSLLRCSVCDGWEPLCRFLGKDVPDVPFPHANRNQASMGKFTRKVHKEMLFNFSLCFVLMAVMTGLIRWLV